MARKRTPAGRTRPVGIIPPASPAITMKTFNCDFYRIKCRDGFDFIGMLDSLFEDFRTADERNQEMLNGVMALVSRKKRYGGVDGLMIRTRRDPKKVAEIHTHALEPIALTPGKEWADECHFFYHPEFRTLVIQRNRQTGGAHRITDYLKFKLGEHIDSTLVLHPEGIAELAKVQQFTSAQVKVLMPDQLGLWDQLLEPVSSTVGRIGLLGPKLVTISMSMGKGRPKYGMKRDEVNAFVGAFLKMPSCTESLEVKGFYYSPNHTRESIELDLINRRLQASYELEAEAGMDRHAEMLRDAYHRNRDILQDQFRGAKD